MLFEILFKIRGGKGTVEFYYYTCTKDAPKIVINDISRILLDH